MSLCGKQCKKGRMKETHTQKKKRKEHRERGLGLGLCQSGGIWPDGGFTAFECARYTLINSSRLHQSHTCSSQRANYGEEADSDSCWKLPSFQMRKKKNPKEKEKRNLSAQATTMVLRPTLGERAGQARLWGRSSGQAVPKEGWQGSHPPGGRGTWGEVEVPGCGVPLQGWVCPSVSLPMQAGWLFPSLSTGGKGTAIPAEMPMGGHQ